MLDIYEADVVSDCCNKNVYINGICSCCNDHCTTIDTLEDIKMLKQLREWKEQEKLTKQVAILIKEAL